MLLEQEAAVAVAEQVDHTLTALMGLGLVV
jgi:hypothetical protein